MRDLDSLIREADPARDLVIPEGDPAAVRRLSRRPPRSRHRLLDALAGGVGVVVALGVVLVFLLAGGHGRARLTAVGRTPIPAGAEPLARILGVLRRPQTAADRAVESTFRWTNPVLSLVRLASVTPWGQQVVLVAQRTRHDDTLGLFVSGGLAPGARAHAVAESGGTTGITPAGIKAGNGSLMLFLAGGQAHGSSRTSVFMVVPDGVAKVSFVLPPKGLSGSLSGWTAYAPLQSPTVRVPVHGNVAYAQLQQSLGGWVPVTRWYAADGRLIRVTASSASTSAGPVLDLLRANGIGSARFGASPGAVRAAVDSLLGQPAPPYQPQIAQCGVDHSIVWWDDRTANGLPNLVAYFGHSKFVGYQYGEYSSMIPPHPPVRGAELATGRGLRIGDSLARGQRLYGRAFTLSSAQGGTWNLHTRGGPLDGYAWGTPKYGDVSSRSLVATIDAGDVGCPALAP